MKRDDSFPLMPQHWVRNMLGRWERLQVENRHPSIEWLETGVLKTEMDGCACQEFCSHSDWRITFPWPVIQAVI